MLGVDPRLVEDHGGVNNVMVQILDSCQVLKVYCAIASKGATKNTVPERILPKRQKKTPKKSKGDTKKGTSKRRR